MSMLEAKVEGLALDMTTNSPVVILAPLSVNKVLPIWIGHAEAWGIAIQLTGIDRKSTRLNSSHIPLSRMPSSA